MRNALSQYNPIPASPSPRSPSAKSVARRRLRPLCVALHQAGTVTMPPHRARMISTGPRHHRGPDIRFELFLHHSAHGKRPSCGSPRVLNQNALKTLRGYFSSERLLFRWGLPVTDNRSVPLSPHPLFLRPCANPSATSEAAARIPFASSFVPLPLSGHCQSPRFPGSGTRSHNGCRCRLKNLRIKFLVSSIAL
jgi:hypothetical protein